MQEQIRLLAGRKFEGGTIAEYIPNRKNRRAAGRNGRTPYDMNFSRGQAIFHTLIRALNEAGSKPRALNSADRSSSLAIKSG